MIDWNQLNNQGKSGSGRFVRPLIGLAAAFMLLWAIVLFQGSPVEDSVPEPQSTKSAAEQAVRNDSMTTNSRSLFSRPERSVVERDESGLGMSWLWFVLAFLILGLWYWTGRNKTTLDKVFQLIGSQSIGSGEIKVILINEEVWVVAISGSEISLLDKYDKSEWKPPIEQEDVSEQQKSNFIEHLGKAWRGA